MQNLAARTDTIAAVSGPVDYITDGVTTLTLSGGDARLTLMSPGRGVLGAYSGVIANAGSKPEAVAAARETVSFAIAFIDHLSVIEVDFP
ncbi:hydroxyethylthiazole kinase [Komagataeibacter rhaeticus]|uniref:hydroxyethylthiazole kinase n=1 Tax=Komagataeibacter rhaeticus TaxID=215221 RepID=UPI001CD3DEDE|nr:hydroxyethylthiazole kinase [Komagataeibacter rhaeticus]